MTRAGGIWAVVPVKELARAKSRLAAVCAPDVRRRFVCAMAEDVLATLAAVPALAGVAVVTLDPLVAALAARHGARVFGDGARAGHAGAVTAAAQRLAREGHGGVLALPADIPLIAASEVSSLLAAHRETPALTIVQAHDGRGSNAVLVTPCDALPFAFGENSFFRHVEHARRRGIEPATLSLPGIRFDIDDSRDLASFMERPSRTRSWACLAECGLAQPQPSVRASYEMG